MPTTFGIIYLHIFRQYLPFNMALGQMKDLVVDIERSEDNHLHRIKSGYLLR